MWQGTPLFCLIFLLSLKLECEKLASEKTEMQRHYVMVRGTCPCAYLHALPGKGKLGCQALFLWVLPHPPPPILGTACLSHLSEPNRDPSCGFPVWVPTGLRVFVSCPDTRNPPPEAVPHQCPQGGISCPHWPRLSPLQYYEMSYGLNLEMHKQVTMWDVGVCGKGAKHTHWDLSAQESEI